jgi:hypothetical protein
MIALRVFVAAVALATGALTPFGRVTHAQTTSVDGATSIFRVFLKDGTAVPAYGEAAVVGDQVILSLWLAPSADGPPKSQLISLPAASVDLDRTARYARAVRQAYFAATSGEAEYETLTTEVATTIDALKGVPDQGERLQLALDAEQRLRTWVSEHYDYHGAEIREFVRQLEDVVTQLRSSAGVSSLSMDLVAGTAPVRPEPILPTPTLRESIEAALSLAAVVDDTVTRQAVLRSAVDALGPVATPATPNALDPVGDLRRRVGLELVVDQVYAALAENLKTRADLYQKRGDETEVANLLTELERRDRDLGHRRPAIAQQIADDITARLDVMRRVHAARDRYLADKPRMLQYERDVRPVLSGLDGLKPVLIAIRDGTPAGYLTSTRSLTRVEGFATALPGVTPPAVLASVHGVIGTVVTLAHEAIAKHRQTLFAPNSKVSAEASAAAAGALLLLDQSRRDLLTQLFPPKGQ